VSAYKLIGAEKVKHPISFLCKVLKVSRSGYCAWKGRPPSRPGLGRMPSSPPRSVRFVPVEQGDLRPPAGACRA